ncbi:GCV1 [Candida oxycetoniae]|uniref:Aminomethyltransferase n=1 Tax=Candida oxycetoniae TaxID=497107 RepID=A0AAI9SSS5_9ASCO|nr:GCV1 [Candida oxycetoniae]KAI3402489.1 GCV1 [Candida oxycetoniae]
MLKSAQVVQKRLASSTGLLKTPLYPAHIELGGKMVDYAGFEMPVLYKGQSHIESHNWVRSRVGLFDVSHMLQHNISGRDAKSFIQKITPIDLDQLPKNSSSLSVLLNKDGGVIDDCIITKHEEDQYYMVTNAGCRSKDIQFLKQELQNNFNLSSVNHNTFEGTLLAIQGPKAQELLQKFTNEDLSKIYFGQTRFLKLSPISATVHLARSGYTGEDGFELSIPSISETEKTEALNFFNTLLKEFPEIAKPIGLAARDSLRLEAGMCLYGQELREDLTPVEASLSWLIPKTRRELSSSCSFNGAEKILSQIKNKSNTHRRIGLKSANGPSPRTGNKVFAEDGKTEIGYVTSGSPSPTKGGNIAQAYIDKGAKIGSNTKIKIRDKLRDAVITKLPFVESNLYKP